MPKYLPLSGRSGRGVGGEGERRAGPGIGHPLGLVAVRLRVYANGFLALLSLPRFVVSRVVAHDDRLALLAHELLHVVRTEPTLAGTSRRFPADE